MKKLKFKRITWIDSASITGGGWHSAEDINQLRPLEIKTAGYVVKETKDFITIASQVGEYGFASGEVCIPKFAIKKRKAK